MGKLKIKMLGSSFTIQANEDDEYLEKLLGYYKRITDDVKKIDSEQTPMQIAILSGIMLCDELYKEKQKKVAMEKEISPVQNNSDTNEIERRTLEMISKIDKVL